jgi:hypothetical protein
MIDDRLTELKKEFEKGQQQMALMDQRRQELRDALLRISGAIQVLEELRKQPGLSDSDRPGLSSVAAA